MTAEILKRLDGKTGLSDSQTMSIDSPNEQYDNSAIRNKRNKHFVEQFMENCKAIQKLQEFTAFACTICSTLCNIPLLDESEMPMTTNKLDSLPQRPGFKSAMFSVLCVAVVTIFVLPAAMSQRSHPQQNTPATVTDNELRKLLVARRDVLKEALESAIAFLDASDGRGVGDLWVIEGFQSELSKAELELAESKQDRIDVLTQALERISFFEEQLQSRGEPTSHQLRVKAERLRVEIELHKVKKSP